MKTIKDRMYQEQCPTAQHMELYSVFCDKPEQKRIYEKNTLKKYIGASKMALVVKNQPANVGDLRDVG